MPAILDAQGLCKAFGAVTAAAEVSEIKIGKQYGLPYIQFVIMEDARLIEKHAKQQGLGDIKVDWATLGGPAALNDGIISGAIDVAAVGLPNLITMWEKTRTNVKVPEMSSSATTNGTLQSSATNRSTTPQRSVMRLLGQPSNGRPM